MAAKIYAPMSNKITEREIKNAEIAKKMACECMVLLKNEGILPLASKSRVALYGNGARNTIKGGTGSGDVNTRSFTNIEEGLKEAGLEILTQDWLQKYDNKRKDAKQKYLKFVKEEAKRQNTNEVFVILNNPYVEPEICPICDDDIKTSQTDTAIFVISRNAGEGADRKNEKGDYQLFDSEVQALKTVTEHYKNVILVLNIGGLINMKDLSSQKGIGAIVLMTQLGNLGGKALADLIIGKVNPSGRLSDSWAYDYFDYPSSKEFSYINGNVDDDYYKDGIYVGYRYFDSAKKEVVYPFGYGLSYTDFDLQAESVLQKNDKVEVQVLVKNTGTVYAGKEVVQLYISAPQGKLKKPYQELKGFTKTHEIEAGGQEKVTINLPLESLASYSENSACWIIEKGDYIVRVGKNSRDTKAVASLHFKDDVITQKCQNILPLDCKLEELSFEVKSQKENTPFNIDIDESAITTKENHYTEEKPALTCDKKEKLTLDDVKNGSCSLEELVAQLSVEEMATMCVGVFNTGRKESVIGSASSVVPGAAGETSEILKERKVKKLIMADGPAGLRLLPHFKTDKDGNLLPGGDVFGDSFVPFTNVPEGALDYYQYCTAIPIGWALAQSWNIPLIEETGKMIAGEMQLFGVDLWLAPAQNIHRNPLCGRNFEYYSEDPLLTGKISAAVTRGVQSCKGCGTTIKHFAANNQEENRYFVNAHVSERAMREIYLKGFEIAVKESKPLSLMTSYNLVNGIHAANQKDLLQKVLRDEWGFDGLVMTDWYSSQNITALSGMSKKKYPIAASSGCIFAGNDIQMPGCQKNIDDIVDAVKTGREIDGYKITLGDLQYCVKNILQVIEKM